VIAFAIDAAGVSGFFDGGDGEQAFDEDFEEFDEAAVFLHGDDEGIVLVAEMLLHELCGFPNDELAFGSSGATLGFGSFCGDFFEMLQRIDGGFHADRGLDVRGHRGLGIGERPFQDAVNDQVGIAADGRSEVSVLVEAEREVAEGFGGVAGLLERAKHQVREDALFGFAGEFLDEALIMLRSEIDVGGGKDGAHLSLAAVAARVGASGFGGRGNFAVADGDFALVEIFDAEGIAERAGEFLKLENFAGVGFLVDAMQGVQAALDEVVSDGAIGGEHELFDQAMGDVAFAAADVGHLLLVVELDDGLGEIEIDGAVLGASGVKEECEAFHGAEVMTQMGVARGHFGVALEDLIDVGVRHAFGGADDAGSHPGAEHAAGRVELQDGAEDEALFARFQRAHAVGKSFGKHGDSAIEEVDGVAAEASFAIKRGFRRDVMGNVGDVDLQEPAAVFAAFNVDGIVEVAGGFAVDGNDGKAAKILAAGEFGFCDGAGELFGFVGNFAGKRVGQVMLADDDFGVHAEIAGTAQDFNDTADGSGAFAAVADQFGVDDGAIEFRNVRKARAFAGAIFFTGQQLIAEDSGKFFTGGKFDIVLDAGIVGNDDAATRGVAEKADNGGMGAGDDAEDAALGAAGSGDAAEAGNFGDDVVAVHGVFDEVARDKKVAVEIGNGDVGNDEAVAVVMEDEAAADFVAGNGFVLGEFFGGRFLRGARLCGRLLRAGSLAKEKATMGKFFDEAAFFELGEHLEEGTAAGAADLEGAGEVFQGGGTVSKL